MDCTLLTLLVVALILVRWATPLRCRLGWHVRPRFSGGRGWVCSRCPSIQGDVSSAGAGSADEVAP